MNKKTVYYNGIIFTSNENQPWAEGFVVEDGRFVMVGSNEEVARSTENDDSADSAEKVDLGGRLVIPGLVDAHTHVALSVILDDGEPGDEKMPIWNCQSKDDILQHLRAHVKKHPVSPYYTAFFGQVEALGGEQLTYRDLDKIVKHRPVILLEQESHSAWLNTGAMRMIHLKEDTPDPAPGYSCYERDRNVHLTGCLKEMTMLPLLALMGLIPKKKMRAGIHKIMNYLLEHGVTTIYDAGIYIDEEKTYRLIAEMDRAGEIPIRWEASYIITEPAKAGKAVSELKRYKSLYETEHLKFNTVKIMFDGTHRIRTAKLCTPYGTDSLGGDAAAVPDSTDSDMGGTMLSEKDLYLLLSELNRKGINLHAHTVGEGASKMILDAVDRVRREHENDGEQREHENDEERREHENDGEHGGLKIRVTMAHLESQRDEDIPRFAAPNIYANFTPHWHGGVDYGSMEDTEKLLGRYRANHLFRVKSMIDAGAAVTFSSDEVTLSLLDRWNPFLGMEIGHTRREPNKAEVYNAQGTPDARTAPVFPPAEESLPLEDLLIGYTIQGARQLGLEENIGSIETGKSADFVVLDRNVFEIDPYEIHKTKPVQVVVAGSTLV